MRAPAALGLSVLAVLAVQAAWPAAPAYRWEPPRTGAGATPTAPSPSPSPTGPPVRRPAPGAPTGAHTASHSASFAARARAALSASARPRHAGARGPVEQTVPPAQVDAGLRVLLRGDAEVPMVATVPILVDAARADRAACLVVGPAGADGRRYTFYRAVRQPGGKALCPAVRFGGAADGPTRYTVAAVVAVDAGAARRLFDRRYVGRLPVEELAGVSAGVSVVRR